eukprot:EG_transcript_22421
MCLFVYVCVGVSVCLSVCLSVNGWVVDGFGSLWFSATSLSRKAQPPGGLLPFAETLVQHGHNGAISFLDILRAWMPSVPEQVLRAHLASADAAADRPPTP